MFKKDFLFKMFIVTIFLVMIFPACTGNIQGNGSSSSSSNSSSKEECYNDISCGVGYKCVSGVCTGGIVPEIHGKCVSGSFGKKVCTNTGESCHNNSECWK